MANKIAVLIPAAGASTRFKGKRKKQFCDIDGRAVFLRTVERFADREDVGQVVLAIPADEEELFQIKWGASVGFHGVKVILGDDERYKTVRKLLAEVKEGMNLIALHDAVRPCVTAEQIDAVFAAAAQSGAAILAHRLVGTIKRVGDQNIIAKTLDRTEMWEAQTPQVFKPEIIRRAYENIESVKEKITDDAQLVEALGIPVQVVEGTTSNIKITSEEDIAIAGAILKARDKAKKPKGSAGPFADEREMW